MVIYRKNSSRMLMILLFLIPTLAILSSLYLYQHTGKREILKFDLVQFVYAFVLTPIIYVWLKSFLFVFLVRELDLRLSVTDIFIADTAYTIIFMFVYAFLVIHSLTKSFELKRSRDPFYDIFQHSEFFHLLTSHAAIYIGSVVLISVLSTVNVLSPLLIAQNMVGFYIAIFSGFLVGGAIYIGLFLTDDEFEAKYPRFEMFVRLVFVLVFIFHIGLYFLFRPQFDLSRVMYWFVFMVLAGFVLSSFLVERSEKVVRFLKRLHYKSPERAKKARLKR